MSDSVDHDQTLHSAASVWVHTVCLSARILGGLSAGVLRINTARSFPAGSVSMIKRQYCLEGFPKSFLFQSAFFYGLHLFIGSFKAVSRYIAPD